MTIRRLVALIAVGLVAVALLVGIVQISQINLVVVRSDC